MTKNLKVCICTIGKKENKYIREFVEHYKNYGIDKIFLYDNNDPDDEKFDDIILDYINNGLVEIINIRGERSPQIRVYNHCYHSNNKLYDWFIFYDMDEFLFLKNYQSIKTFLNKKKFNKCQRIQLNWVGHTDNNQLHYENKSLFKRFPQREKKLRGKKIGGKNVIKSMIRGNLNINITCPHTISHKLVSCDGFGNIKDIDGAITNISDLKYYYIDHFYSKSTEEFVSKLMRGSVSDKKAFNKTNLQPKLIRISIYFIINEISLEKIEYIENKTKLNLNNYKTKIKK